jgi:hypothetical protein
MEALPMSIRTSPLLAVAMVSSVIAGCGGGDGNDLGVTPGNNGQGTVNIAITDAPVDFATHVFVEFAGIELTPQSGAPTVYDINPDRSIDLLSLQDGAVITLLQNQAVPAGNYTRVRFLVNATSGNNTNSYVDLATGGRFPLVIPAGSETGLTINRNFSVSDKGRIDLTVDFDLRKSIIAGAMTYTFKPLLRTVDNTQVGTISGTVGSNLVSGLCTPYVYVFTGANVVPDDIDLASDVDPVVSVPVKLNNSTGNYTYRASFLESGAYTVSYVCLTDTRDDNPEAEDSLAFLQTLQGTVTAGQTTTVNFGS